MKPEAYLQSNVIKLCRSRHLLAYHTHDSRRSEPGFPDLVIVGAGGVLFVELKSETGRVSPDQRKWLDALEAAGVRALLWRPADLYSGRIDEELRLLARPRRAGCPSCRSALGEEDAAGKRTFTIVGLTDECGELTVAGVFRGEHNAVDSDPGQDGAYRFATSVRAANADEAEQLAHDEVGADDDEAGSGA